MPITNPSKKADSKSDGSLVLKDRRVVDTFPIERRPVPLELDNFHNGLNFNENLTPRSFERQDDAGQSEEEGRNRDEPGDVKPRSLNFDEQRIDQLRRLYPGLSEPDLIEIDAAARRRELVAHSDAPVAETPPVDSGSDLAGAFGAAVSDSGGGSSGDLKPLPTVAPVVWTRKAGMSSADFVRKVYGDWIGNGLTRAHLRQLDRRLYQTFSTWIFRMGDRLPEDLASFRDDPERVGVELADAGILHPSDAYKKFPDDPAKADRLYQAAKRRM